jgi:PAS domain S-box-containing protein
MATRANRTSRKHNRVRPSYKARFRCPDHLRPGLEEVETRLLDFLEQAVIVTDPDGRLIYQNRFAKTLLGWTAGKSTPDGAPFNRELAILARAGLSKSWAGELIVHRWDGTPFPAMITVSPVHDKDGLTAGIVSVFTDVTMQKQVERTLQYYIKRLGNLRDIEHAVLAAQSPERIAEVAISQVRQLIPCLWAGVAAFDLVAEEARLLALQATQGTTEIRFAADARLPLKAFDVPELLASRKAYVVEDIQRLRQADKMPCMLEMGDIRAYACVPLIAHDELIGSLNLAATAPGAFAVEQIEMIQEVADQLALVIFNAQLLDEVRRYATELERRVAERTAALSEANEQLSQQIQERNLAEAAEREQRAMADSLREIAGILNSTLNLDEVLVRILANIGQVVPHNAANILFIESDIARLVRCYGYDQHVAAEAMVNLEFPIDAVPYMKQAAATRRAAIIPDTGNFPGWIASPGREWVRSSISVPIVLEGSVIGFLSVDSSMPGFFTPLHAERLGAFADQAATAIQNARLYEQSQAIAALEERQRLSHELHDAISQTLWSASLIADVLPALWEQNIEKGRQKLTRLRQLTRGALAEMRTLLLELHPTALVEVGLDDLIQRLCDITTSRTGIIISPILEGPIGLPPDVQIALYRIAQESLANIARHAAATQIDVHLHGEHDSLKLAIRDNGRGFRVDDSRPGHLGLDIMRQRAQSIGASVLINSQIGQGTEIVVMWSSHKE